MPTINHWSSFLFVNLGFALFIIGIFYVNKIEEIKEDWNTYRCNPMYMPLADNVQENFEYCVQDIQGDYMGYLLEPITAVMSAITSSMGNVVNELNGVRAMFSKIRGFMGSIVENIFGVFMNLIIEFQRIIIALKDLMGKTIGTLVTFMYLMDGSIKTMGSAWNGPSGQLVKTLGKCFDPDTLIKKKSGDIVKISEIKIGDVLHDDSIVEATMQIDNKIEPEDIYEIKDISNNNPSIYVTGTHLVFDKCINKYTKVCNYKNALKSCKKLDSLVCLITNTHNIKIENETFWDWEDHYIKVSSLDLLNIVFYNIIKSIMRQ